MLQDDARHVRKSGNRHAAQEAKIIQIARYSASPQHDSVRIAWQGILTTQPIADRLNITLGSLPALLDLRPLFIGFCKGDLGVCLVIDLPKLLRHIDRAKLARNLNIG